jgi:Tfp pilus assembly protein PilN
VVTARPTPPGQGNGGKRRRIRTGVALSMTELCASDLRLGLSSARGWRRPLDPPSENGGGWPSLAAALGDLARDLGTSDGTLVVSLMQPLTEVRRLELPPLRDEELEQLLTRNAGRYFVNARGAQIVGAARAARQTRGRPTPVVAAAAPARLVALIRAAAHDAGWTVEDIAPAEVAWASAAVAIWPSLARQTSRVLVTHEDRTDLLQLEDGGLTGVRRFRAGAAGSALIADAIREDSAAKPRIAALGRGTQRRELLRALSDHGITIETPTGNWVDVAELADLLAAQFAGANEGLRLRGPDARIIERAAAKRATLMVAAAAVALFAVAGAIEFWGIRRELRIVQAERATLRPQIASTLVGRSTIEAAYTHLATLNGVDASAPRWSRVIASLSEHLPEEAFLMGIRTRGDSLVVDGLAERAARAFDALERMPGFTNVRSAAAVRRELQEDGSALEHFTIAGRIEPERSATFRTAPASNTVARKPERAP